MQAIFRGERKGERESVYVRKEGGARDYVQSNLGYDVKYLTGRK